MKTPDGTPIAFDTDFAGKKHGKNLYRVVFANTAR